MTVATMGVTVLDCPDPKALAEFYGAVLGWQVDEGDEDDWVELIGPHGRTFAFQEAPGMVPPQWPGTEHSQQFHLDLDVPKDRLDEAEQQVVALGARLLQGDEGGASATGVSTSTRPDTPSASAPAETPARSEPRRSRCPAPGSGPNGGEGPGPRGRAGRPPRPPVRHTPQRG
ncbi:hypothetical protein N566_20410 [Streptomycetaceae bacterium MP113-05]|nr:hypothetical protein N566_20410 [Streptomycetaceae bacterium MP113-05]